MSTVVLEQSQSAFETAEDLIESLGVPASRIRMRPIPGTATIEDAIRQNRLCELIDGVLVEKAVGYYESIVAAVLSAMISSYLKTIGDIAFVFGEAGMIWVNPNQMRMADVAVVLWSHFPDRKLPRGQVLDLVPDWAIEVLSPTNTVKELQRKRREYFDGGAKLVWQIYPETKTIEVYTQFDRCATHGEEATIDGSPVLPGFTMLIRTLFERAGQRECDSNGTAS